MRDRNETAGLEAANPIPRGSTLALPLPPIEEAAALASEARQSAEEHSLAPTRRGPVAHPRRASALGSGHVRLALAVLALLALGAGGALAAGVFSADEIATSAGVACYETPSLDASATIFQAAADPIAKCARFWRMGVVDTHLRRLEREGKIDQRPHRGTPILTACTAKGEGVDVFPASAAVCARLGLVPVPTEYAPRAIAHARAYRAWFEIEKAGAFHAISKQANGGCVPAGLAARLARSRVAGLDRVHSAVSVSIQGRQPCSKELSVQGDQIVVKTNSTRQSADELKAKRVSEALSPLTQSLKPGKCRQPDQFLRRARHLISLAGLEQVEVHMIGDGPCVGAGSGTRFDHGFVIEFFAEDPWWTGRD